MGLQDVDFDKIKFMTIIADNTQTIIKSHKISEYAHIRLKIQPDLSIKVMEKAEAENLK